ncbi:hypothetical protein DITRI_Ditri13aG0167400 [Diplodiscus trichospermus]
MLHNLFIIYLQIPKCNYPFSVKILFHIKINDIVLVSDIRTVGSVTKNPTLVFGCFYSIKSSEEISALSSSEQQQLKPKSKGVPYRLLSSSASLLGTAKMYTSRKKIHKDNDAEPTEFEETVAQALFDLENINQDFKTELQDLFINSAVQMDIFGNRKAVVIYVPYRLRKAFRKVHLRLVRELEKKFSGRDVVVLATRRILRPPKKGSAVQRPRTRTLTAVHDAMLEDIVHPAEIVGKRARYRIDGTKIMKVLLDPKEKNNTEYKLETIAGVYRKLTGNDVVFEYPITEA